MRMQIFIPQYSIQTEVQEGELVVNSLQDSNISKEDFIFNKDFKQ